MNDATRHLALALSPRGRLLLERMAETDALAGLRVSSRSSPPLKPAAGGDYSNRLPRGRNYVRNGSVIDLQIAGGKIRALVQGSELYKILVSIRPLEAKRWHEF